MSSFIFPSVKNRKVSSHTGITHLDTAAGCIFEIAKRNHSKVTQRSAAQARCKFGIFCETPSCKALNMCSTDSKRSSLHARASVSALQYRAGSQDGEDTKLKN